jgi:hypothetical protein
MTTYQQKITYGEMRASGVERQARDLRRKCRKPDRQHSRWDLT